MRLVIARCSVDYVGRLTAHLPEAVRLLMVKADGSVLVHSDTGGYKPLMWMTPPCALAVNDDLWTVTNKAGEQLLITVHEVLSDVGHELGKDPGLVKDGVEKHLQELLADRCEVLGTGWTLVQREYFTDIGPVDLLCRDEAGAHVLVEVKRHAEIDGVEQLTRYLQRVSTVLGDVKGVLAAQSFKPQAKVLAADRGIVCVQLDYDELRGMASTTPTLF
jgi:RecB family endonuclease NucS